MQLPIIPIPTDSANAPSENEDRDAETPLAEGLGEQLNRRTSTRAKSKPRPSRKNTRESREFGIDSSHSSIPRDEKGEEMSSHARVWQVYLDEATRADAKMIDEWNRSIDVLLVFAGLFSAVLTTFLVQAYTLLSPDPFAVTNALLLDILTAQTDRNNSSTSVAAPSTPFAAPPYARWLNGLWFASLSLSLSSALISMLAKQWLQAYSPPTSGSPRDRARVRQMRFISVETWRVPAIIEVMPLVLHLSLLLFFAGLVALLWSLDRAVMSATLFIVAISYIFYGVTLALPIWFPDCPYRTPIAHRLRIEVMRFIPRMFEDTADLSVGIQSLEKQATPDVVSLSPDRPVADSLDFDILRWLLTNSTDQEVNESALHAIAGLPTESTTIPLHSLDFANIKEQLEHAFQLCFHRDPYVDSQWYIVDVDRAELCCRAWIKVAWDSGELWPLEIIEPLWTLQDAAPDHPDAAVVASCAVALSSVASPIPIWDLLVFLSQLTTGTIHLDVATQCLLLETIGRCGYKYELPSITRYEAAIRATPLLLLLLKSAKGIPSLVEIRHAASHALYRFVSKTSITSQHSQDSSESTHYRYVLLPSLAAVANAPESFGVQGSLFAFAAKELAHLASRMSVEWAQLSYETRELTRSSLCKLLLDGHLSKVDVPVLVDVLRLLFPIKTITEIRHLETRLVTTLLTILKTKSTLDGNLELWTVRFLQELLYDCRPDISFAFHQADGISLVLKAAFTAQVDNDLLQLDSLRVLGAYIGSLARIARDLPSDQLVNVQLDFLFKSDLFPSLRSKMQRRQRWGKMLSSEWLLGPLDELGKVRPAETWAARHGTGSALPDSQESDGQSVDEKM